MCNLGNKIQVLQINPDHESTEEELEESPHVEEEVLDHLRKTSNKKD